MTELPFEDPLAAEEIRSRAIAGTATLAVRGVLIRAMGFAGTFVLARLLTPADFGLVAIGFTVVAFAQFVADGGLGAALIRRPRPPSRRELETLLGLQELMAAVVVFATFVVGAFVGRAGWITAVMVSSLLLVVQETPGAILLERRLDYRRRVLVELAETLAYFGWALTAVELGAGVWGLATASVARGLAGAVVMMFVAPVRVLRPRFRFTEVRQLLGFGARYQAVSVINLLRDQGLNVMLVFVGGVSTLGVWSLAYRVLQVPFLLFESLWRVSFPALSRLLSAGHDVRHTLVRILTIGSVATGLVLAGLAGASPHLLGIVLGHQWESGSGAIAPACLGLMVSAPVSVTAAGYLYASGSSKTVLWAAILHTAAWFAVAFGLYPTLGVAAMGWGWAASGLVDTIVMSRALRRREAVRVTREVGLITVMAVAAGGAGYLLADLAPDVFHAIAGGLAAELTFGLAVLLLRPELFGNVVRLVIQGGRGIGRAVT